MAIRRNELSFETNFTRIPNSWLRDVRLSRRARGLLAELMSHRIGWRSDISTLTKSGPEGREAIRSIVNELLAAGYVTRVQQRSEHGTWAETDYVLSDPTDVGRTGVGKTDIGQHNAKEHYPKEDHLEEDHHEEVKPQTNVRGRASTTEPASDAQLKFLMDMHVDLGIEDEAVPDDWALMSKAEASDLIDELKHEWHHLRYIDGLAS